MITVRCRIFQESIQNKAVWEGPVLDPVKKKKKKKSDKETPSLPIMLSRKNESYLLLDVVE